MEKEKRPQTRIDPEIPRTDPRFQYIPAAATDVQRTWRRFGWIPQSEVKK